VETVLARSQTESTAVYFLIGFVLSCERAETRQQVKDQLEALVLQMYKSNILYSEAVREFKKRFIVTVLEENRCNQCKAARQLDMHRNTLSRTMQELKIDVRSLRAGAKRPPRSTRLVTQERKQAR
jgi:Fis family transcriptional regulator, factor for inversion stimulation protein